MSMVTSTETDQVFAAFVAAQSEFLHVVEDSKVAVGGGSKAGYASLPQVLAHVRPILNKHGIAIAQPPTPAQGGVHVRTKLVHVSGQWFSDDGIFIPASKLDPQGHGSALSYARRYGLLAMLGVATNDDDGAGALQGIEREAKARAEAIAAAANRIEQAQVDVLKSIAGVVMPDTPDEKLQARYAAVLKDDYESTLRQGLDHAAKAEKIDPGTADDICVAALGGDYVAAINLTRGGTA